MRQENGKFKYYILAGACLCLFHAYSSKGQEHLIHHPEHSIIRLAGTQYDQGHYILAKQSAERYLQEVNQGSFTAPVGEIENARYILALSLLKTEIKGAEDSAQVLISNSANPVVQQRISFALAQYYFQHEHLAKAISYYESANVNNLTNQEVADSKFELAYCYFSNKQFDRAAPLFASIKEVQGKYYLAGNYYYGLLAYNNNNYAAALESFRRIENEKQYSGIVPYYIAEIHYFSGDKTKALDESLRLLKRQDKLFYDNELHLLAAQVLFEDQKYENALPYFEYYYDHVDKIRKEELYELAYAYYRINEWEKAINKFKLLSNTKDSLGQTAMYLLGDCYLKTGDKKSARNAFGICSEMLFNKGQQEASLFLYGKLSYEMGYNDAAARDLKLFVTNFPHSSVVSEARTLMSDLFTRTNNYADAYETLKDATERTEEYWRVSQRVCYGYAIQQLQIDNLPLAYTLLTLSLKQPVDRYYEAAANFWLGDIDYKQHKPQASKSFLLRYLNLAEKNKAVEHVSPQANIRNAYLDLGYVSMDLEDFATAQSYFNMASQTAGNSSFLFISNAGLGEANAAFMQKNYTQASELYEKIIVSNGDDADYARLQRAIIAGIQGKTTEKINQLLQLLHKQPESSYAEDAGLELGITYVEADKYAQAISVLQPLTTSATGKNLASKAWIKIGFAYQELGNNQKAIEAYGHILSDFPSSEDRPAALAALRSLYIESNQPEAYAALVKSLNLPAEGNEAMDTTYYAAAETQFAAGRYESAAGSFEQYLTRFPNGAFVTRAHYYIAESQYQLRAYKQALLSYEILLSLPWSEFTENSAKRAAQINYDSGDFAAALKDYQQLRNTAMGRENLQAAYNGLMKSCFNVGDFEKATSFADTLLTMPELPVSIQSDVQFYKAKALQRQSRNDEALIVYNQLATGRNDAIASEVKYHIAEIYFLQDKLPEAETAAGEAIKLTSGNEYWVVRSYLLITDILIKQKDYFNAKATLQSIVKNTKNSDLKKEASQKMEQVKSMEKQQSKLTEE